MDQLHTIGSYGFSNAVLPLEGETLTLRIEDQVDVEAQYPAISVGSCAFSGVKIKKEPLFPRRALPLGERFNLAIILSMQAMYLEAVRPWRSSPST